MRGNGSKEKNVYQEQEDGEEWKNKKKGGKMEGERGEEKDWEVEKNENKKSEGVRKK